MPTSGPRALAIVPSIRLSLCVEAAVLITSTPTVAMMKRMVAPARGRNAAYVNTTVIAASETTCGYDYRGVNRRQADRDDRPASRLTPRSSGAEDRALDWLGTASAFVWKRRRSRSRLPPKLSNKLSSFLLESSMARTRLNHHTASGRPRSLRRSGITAVLLIVAFTAVLPAQTPPGRAWYERLVDGIAALVYNVAWPTATYERVTFGSLRPVANGADVTFRLHGKSALADGDLWLDVIMKVRSGEITGLEWGDYNGFFPPGLTTGTLLGAVNEVTKPSPTRPAASPTSAAVAVACIDNRTNGTVNFKLKRGQGAANFSLPAGQAMIFTAPVADRAFEVTFDNRFTEGYQPASLRFHAGIRSPRPDSCTEDLKLAFTTSGDRLGITTVTWSPGFPSAYDDSILQSTEKDKWVCASGFRPYPWPGGQGLQCIGSTVGVIGLSLEKDPSGPFLRIATVYPGSPAAAAGLVAGMTVISIDAASTDGLDAEAAVSKLRGPLGGRVRLGVVATGTTPIVVTLTRQ